MKRYIVTGAAMMAQSEAVQMLRTTVRPTNEASAAPATQEAVVAAADGGKQDGGKQDGGKQDGGKPTKAAPEADKGKGSCGSGGNEDPTPAGNSPTSSGGAPAASGGASDQDNGGGSTSTTTMGGGGGGDAGEPSANGAPVVQSNVGQSG